MIPASPPPDHHSALLALHRRKFIFLVVIFTLLVATVILKSLRYFHDAVPFDSSFWFGITILGVVAAALGRISRLRNNARSEAESDRSRH